MVHLEILEDQLAMLQELQAGLFEKIRGKSLPGHVYDSYMARVVELSADIRKIARDISEIRKRESAQ